jgi:hypothetical protein
MFDGFLHWFICAFGENQDGIVGIYDELKL